MVLFEASEKRRIFHCIVIAAIAFCWYSLYYDLRINLHDEGYILYNVQRIMAGEIPYRDYKEVGYGVLWFYPIVLIFTIFGESFNVMRIFQFSIFGLTGMLSFYIVDKMIRNRIIAYAAAILILVFHARIYKALLPFSVVLSILVFTECQFSQKNKFIPFTTAGFATGVISLIRPEHGYASAFLLFVFALYAAVGERRMFSLHVFLRSLSYGCLGIVLAYLPLLLFGARYGFLKDFLWDQARYGAYCVSLVLSSIFGDAGALSGVPLTNRTRLPLADMMRSLRDFVAAVSAYGISAGVSTHYSVLRDFVTGVATYGSPVLLAAAGAGAFLAPRGQTPGTTLPDHIRHIGVILISLSPVFFSFFSFQPALWHYVQVVPPLILLYAVLTGKRLQYGRDGSRPLARRALSVICVGGGAFLLFTVLPPINQNNLTFGPLTLSYSNARLEIPSLVSSRMPAAELERITSLLSALDRYTAPGDVIAVYPYTPGLYALSGRKHFNRRLYIDDQVLASDPQWCEKEIKRFEDNPPKAVFICNHPINRTERSRFANWAKPVYEHVTARYRLVLTQADNECGLYVLKGDEPRR